MNLVVGSQSELKDPRGVEFSLSHKDVEIFREFHGVVPDSWLVDRSKNVILPFDGVVLEENKFPDFDSLPQFDLSTACDLRAKELVDTGKNITLLWSGGIDSTLMLVSFLKNSVNTDQITVACNYESIKENPEFYSNHVLKNFKIVATERLMQSLKFDITDSIIVSAEPADLLCGIDIQAKMLKTFGPEFLYLKPSRENIVKFFLTRNMSFEAANCWYDLLIESTKSSKRPIDTTSDISWWVSFNWRWQYTVEKFKLRYNTLNNFIAFFSSKEFQSWSVHRELLDIKCLEDFKTDYKDLIFEFDKNQNYRDKKIKHESVTLYYIGNTYSGLLDDSTRLTNKEYSIFDFYQKNNYINSWLGTV